MPVSYSPSFSPAYSPAYKPGSYRGGDPLFLYDAAHTYWFDPDYSGNLVSTVADYTYAEIANRIRPTEKLVKYTKDYQLLVGDEGFKGLANDSRGNSWEAGDVAGFANGHDGCSIIANIYVESSDYFVFSNGRINLYFPSNRQLGFKHAYDGGGYDWAFRAPALNFDTWYTVAMVMDYTADGGDGLATFYYNEVQQSLAYSNAETFSAASTDQGASLVCGEGQTKGVIYNDTLVSTEILNSQMAYLASIRP